MSDDLSTLWGRIDEHGKMISELEKRDAVFESRLEQITRSMEDLKHHVTIWLAEQRMRSEQTDDKIGKVKESIDSGIGAISMAKWGVGFFVSFVTIGVAVAAIVSAG